MAMMKSVLGKGTSIKIIRRIIMTTACLLLMTAGPLPAEEALVMKHPHDPVVMPAHLENMRPGQVRDAVAGGYTCLLPVGVLEYVADDIPLGIDRQLYLSEIRKLAEARKAVIAPPIWYAPTGYEHSTARQGTVDISCRAFEAFLESVIDQLRQAGFRQVEIVLVNNPHGTDSLLMNSCRFVIGNLFNKTGSESDLGPGYYTRLTETEISAVYARQRLTQLNLPAERRRVSPERPKLPMRLESMTPLELAGALRAGIPVYLPMGVIEGHGNQNPLGVDAIHAEGPVLLAAEKTPLIVAPTIWYGGTGHWSSGPPDGDLSIGGPEFRDYLETTVEGLLELGFRNLVLVQHHQGGGAQRGAVGAVMAGQRARLGRLSRQGLIAREDMPVLEMNIGFQRTIGDHAGSEETSLMLYLRPGNADLSLLRQGDYRFCWGAEGRRAIDATFERGQTAVNNVVEDITAAVKQRTRPREEKK